MRIAIANDGFSDVGGVQVYLDAVTTALEARGHSLAFAYCTDDGSQKVASALGRMPRFHVAGPQARAQVDAIRQWGPDICYSHNMSEVDVDAKLAGIAPVVKFMHGYTGTCISGLKTHAFPSPTACDRVYGTACLALFFPRRCGRLSLTALADGWRSAQAAQTLLSQYAAIVVASRHMRREYERNGGGPGRVHVNPLFPSQPVGVPLSSGFDGSHVAFLGRMTTLKGGDLLIRAVRHATVRLGQSIRLTMIGDGPQRPDWEALAQQLSVPCSFTGWVTGDDRWKLLATASVVAVPSVWPEPFGLVGLEAGNMGIPAIAVDVGGIGEWLRNGVNGVAVPAPASPGSFGDALAALLGDRDRLKSLSEGARQVAREMTLNAHVDRLESIFESVLAEKVSG
jgi:glycosyltransferase involved in cell wall biosynthesis